MTRVAGEGWEAEAKTVESNISGGSVEADSEEVGKVATRERECVGEEFSLLSSAVNKQAKG